MCPYPNSNAGGLQEEYSREDVALRNRCANWLRPYLHPARVALCGAWSEMGRRQGSGRIRCDSGLSGGRIPAQSCAEQRRHAGCLSSGVQNVQPGESGAVLQFGGPVPLRHVRLPQPLSPADLPRGVRLWTLTSPAGAHLLFDTVTGIRRLLDAAGVIGVAQRCTVWTAGLSSRA